MMKGKEKIIVYERLIGKNCYIFGEIEGIRGKLKNFFENIEVILYKGRNVLGRQFLRL